MNRTQARIKELQSTRDKLQKTLDSLQNPHSHIYESIQRQLHQVIIELNRLETTLGQDTGRADYLRLAALAFDFAEARNFTTARPATTAARNDCATPELYHRWCDLCELIALDKIITPAAAVDYLQAG